MNSKGSVRADKIAQDVLKQTCDIIRQHSVEFPDTGAFCKRLMRRIKEKFFCDSQQEDKTEGMSSDSEEIELERFVRKIHKENELNASTLSYDDPNPTAEDERIFEKTYSILKGLGEGTKDIIREDIIGLWRDSKKNFIILDTITEFAAAAPSKTELLVALMKAIATEEVRNDLNIFKAVLLHCRSFAPSAVSMCCYHVIDDKKKDDDFGRIMLNLMNFAGHLCLNGIIKSNHINEYMIIFFESYATNPIKTSEVLIRSAARLLTVCGGSVDKEVVDGAMTQMRRLANSVDEETRTQIKNLETLKANGWK